MLEYPGMNRRMSWPSACRYLSRAPDTSARPPALANGVTSADAKQIFNGIAGSYRSARRPLVKPLLWCHAFAGDLPDAPGLARDIDRDRLHCLGLAALVPLGALVRGQLATGPLMSTTPYVQLEQEWRRLHAFHGALSLLRWDAAVMMPRGSAEVRGEQLAALETEYHAVLTTPKVARLLERAEANTQGLADWQVANLREMR